MPAIPAFPTCPAGCATALDVLPTFAFSDCAPVVNAAEIRRIFLGLPNQPFTDWTDGTEWATRLDPANATAKKIVAMTVLGDKPKPSGAPKEISGGRKITLDRDHTLNATVDETSDENHEAFRKMECGNVRYAMWYETSGGKMFGGPAGILVNIDPGMVISRTKTDSIVWELTMTWTAKFTEQMIASPIF